MTLHPLLEQQLESLDLDGRAPTPEAWRALLDEVSRVYAAAGQEPKGSERQAAGWGRAAPPAQTSDEREKLGTVIASLDEGLLVLDESLRVESVNARGEEILHIQGAAMVGRPIDEIAAHWPLRDRGPFRVSKMRHHLQRGIPYRNDDAFVVGGQGEILHVSLVMTPILRGPQQHGAVICLRDITDLKTTENRLRESEQRFRHIFQSAPVGMIRIAADSTIADSNQAFQDMVGYCEDDLHGESPVRLWQTSEATANLHRLETLLAGKHTSWQGEQGFVHADGKGVWTNTSLALVRFADADESFLIGVVEDTTERKRLEVELRHAQKLESLGRLSAGIAHEINTPIQFIGDNAHFLGTAFDQLIQLNTGHPAPGDEQARADLEFLTTEVPLAIEQTLAGVQRVSTIVGAMKQFGLAGAGPRIPVDLNEAVERTIVVARAELEAVADVQINFGTVPPVTCEPTDVNQVLLNLLLNAADAVADAVAERGGRGRIGVQTRLRDDGVEIAVSDTGGGIPADIHDRVFDPFFTTKAVGRGTGQGLALAHAVVVDRHGGRLEFDSEPATGTTFRMWLPLGSALVHEEEDYTE